MDRQIEAEVIPAELLEGDRAISIAEDIELLSDAVDAFAARMKARLTTKALAGYWGWSDPLYAQNILDKMSARAAKAGISLVALREKDPIDIADFNMMLWWIGWGKTSSAYVVDAVDHEPAEYPRFASLVEDELRRARSSNATLNSAHEAYAVILEELQEFWGEVMKKRSLRSPANMLAELIQVAAMAQRAAEDLGLMAMAAQESVVQS
jgi:hypothetical protein